MRIASFPKRAQLLGDVVGDLGHPIAGHGAGVLAGLLGGLRVARPARSRGLVAVVAEELHPAAPGLAVEPEAMNEDDRSLRLFRPT